MYTLNSGSHLGVDKVCFSLISPDETQEENLCLCPASGSLANVRMWYYTRIAFTYAVDNNVPMPARYFKTLREDAEKAG